ncbi:HMG-Y-related protein A-like [Chenopodium quinoa]|uniref:H15 domain-containing protein n=1 Tax=Chenopodium quinoa TaxID=63459 RepID=A0A803KMJ5_CHEQI|nr:HMG-Y-related protein A-like [Chenopodium quinoa]
MAFQDHPSFPDYPQMIMGAIEGLNEKEGSSKEAITNYIESNYVDLPPTHATHVGHTLEKLRQTGQLMMLKDDTYILNDEQQEEEELADEPTNGLSGLTSSPIKRGRGRPPKPKGNNNTPSGPGQIQPVRPRGRPPKERDPLAPVTRPSKPPSSGRPRGRPKKNPSEVSVSSVTGGGAGIGGVKRGRGRPRKS